MSTIGMSIIYEYWQHRATEAVWVVKLSEDFEHLPDADGSAQYCTHRLNASGFSPQSRSARGDDGKAILDLKVGSNSSRFGANDAERRLPRLR